MYKTLKKGIYITNFIAFNCFLAYKSVKWRQLYFTMGVIGLTAVELIVLYYGSDRLQRCGVIVFYYGNDMGFYNYILMYELYSLVVQWGWMQ